MSDLSFISPLPLIPGLSFISDLSFISFNPLTLISCWRLPLIRDFVLGRSGKVKDRL